MNRLVSFISLMIVISLMIAVPRLAMILWAFFFYPDTFELYQKIAYSLAWVLGGIALLYAMNRPLQNGFFRAIADAKPNGFVSEFELAGPYRDLYFGVSPKTRQILIIDSKRKVTRCEDFSFFQSWSMEAGEIMTCLTLRFNSLDYPSMKISILKPTQDDVAARLNFLLG